MTPAPTDPLACVVARLAELESVSSKAPWRFPLCAKFKAGSIEHGIGSLYSDGDNCLIYTAPVYADCGMETFQRQANDGMLIAELRNALPTILSALRDAVAMRDALDHVKAEIQGQIKQMEKDGVDFDTRMYWSQLCGVMADALQKGAGDGR
jgi:hypothetical protein